jgi:tetratricopeptide (TPR) repeat protein
MVKERPNNKLGICRFAPRSNPLPGVPACAGTHADRPRPGSPALTVPKKDPLAAGGVCAALLVCLLAGTGWAQSHAPDATTAKDLIRQAYAKTQDAKSMSDYAEILRLTEQAQRGELSSALKDYLQQLQAWTHNRRGELYAQEGATLSKSGEKQRAAKADQQALTEFETAVQLNPSYWKGYHNRGVSYALGGKVDEAIADFGRVIELQPSYANAWFNRGEIYYDRGQLQEALHDYEEAIRLKPDDHEAYIRRGHTRFQLGKYGEALADYNRAVELAPAYPEALANRGDAYRSMGQWSRADADYRRALELDPNSARARQSAAWLMATCPEAEYRNDQLAVQYAEKALELIGHDDYQYLDTLAAAYANAGDFPNALQKVQAAVKLVPAPQAATLKKRMALYEQRKPFREGTSPAGRPSVRRNEPGPRNGS